MLRTFPKFKVQNPIPEAVPLPELGTKYNFQKSISKSKYNLTQWAIPLVLQGLFHSKSYKASQIRAPTHKTEQAGPRPVKPEFKTRERLVFRRKTMP